MSIPRGRIEVFSLETELVVVVGEGNSNVNAMPASVAKLMNGMVKMSMPKEICLRTWWGDDGSSSERRGSVDMAVVAGMSGSMLES